MRYQALIFDLFGTVVLFHPNVPAVPVAGTVRRSTMAWLGEQVEQELPDVPFDEFLKAMSGVTEEIIRGRHPEYYEVPSRERFRRVLARLGHDHPRASETAERLSLLHMAHLAASTEMPGDHLETLNRLRRSFALGLVSNFDHGPTARAVLARNGLTDIFPATVISAYFGRRKPHPNIFHEALRQLGVEASAALFIGDTIDDDVAGARAAGLDVVWINARDVPRPAGAPAPTYTIRRFSEVVALLGLDR